VERKITLTIRKRLAAELSGDELPQQLQNRVRRLVQEELGIAPGPTSQHQRIEARRSSSK
jgi:hypothetical protein